MQTKHKVAANPRTKLTDFIIIRAVPDLFFSNPAGAGFCRIWNDKSGRNGAGLSNWL